MSEGTNRRDFIKYTAATGMGFWVAARKTWAQEATDSKSPNEKVNFACIGVTGKGDSDSLHCAAIGNVVAMCDTDERNLRQKAASTGSGRRRRGGGGAGAPGGADEVQHFAKARQFTDYRRMFDEMGKEFDAITVSIPDHSHAAAAMMGIKNGKAVYCQKPMTHYVAEARALRLAANEHKVATSLGNQGTASNGLRAGVEAIRAGAIGNVHAVHVWTNRPIWPQAPRILDRPMEIEAVPTSLNWDAWIGPAPFRGYNHAYQPFNWRGWWDFGTGALGDMGCHTANLPFMALRLAETYPTRVKADSGIVNPETYPSWASVVWDFPARSEMPPVTVYWYEGQKEMEDGTRVHNWPPAELFYGEKIVDSGSIMVGDKGVLYSPDDYGESWKLLPANKFRDFKAPPPTLPRNGGGDPGMKREWVAAIKGGPPSMANFNYAGKLTEMLLLGNCAIRAGVQHPLEWDGEAMKFTNWPEANGFLKREYRKGWEL